MNKIGFGMTITAAALILTLAAGTAVSRLNSATSWQQLQTGAMIDSSDAMKKIDVRTLAEENWPAM